MEKIKRNVYEALPEYTKFLKMCTVCEKAGMSSQLLNQKISRKNRMRILEKDLSILNDAIEEVCNDLKQRYIEYTNDREELNKQVKLVLEYIKMVYILNSLGKTRGWYDVRMYSPKEGRNVSTFSKDEIDSINLELLKIVTKLEQTELVLDSEE